jgi:hypothetical protein
MKEKPSCELENEETVLRPLVCASCRWTSGDSVSEQFSSFAPRADNVQKRRYWQHVRNAKC